MPEAAPVQSIDVRFDMSSQFCALPGEHEAAAILAGRQEETQHLFSSISPKQLS